MPRIIYLNFVSTVEINAGHVLLIICCSLERLPFSMHRPDRLPLNGFLLRQLYFHLLKNIIVQLELLQLHMQLINYELQLHID